MPLLLRVLDVKPLTANHVGVLVPRSGGGSSSTNDASSTAGMQSLHVAIAGRGTASTGTSTSIVEATATDDADTCRVLLPSSALPTNGSDGDGDDAVASHLVFVNGFYASSDRRHHHVPAASRQPATLYLSDVEVLHTVRGEVERQRRREVAREQNGNNKKRGRGRIGWRQHRQQ